MNKKRFTYWHAILFAIGIGLMQAVIDYFHLFGRH